MASSSASVALEGPIEEAAEPPEREFEAGADAEPVVSVVMPTMDEEDGIAECIARTRRALAELDVEGEIIVSDSSSDRTPEIARELGATVVEPDRPGYGYAYRYAFERARGRYVAMGDADTTYDFEELPKLFDLLEDGADIAMGSRLAGEIEPGAMPALHRYVGNPVLTRVLNVLYDADVSDAHSGFRMVTREALEQLDLRSDGMEFASEMIMDAHARGLRIEETPITYHERTGEAKLESVNDGWRHVKFMLVNAPGYLFALPATVLCLAGPAVMALALSGFDPAGVQLGVHSLVAGSLMTLVGVQMMSLMLYCSLAGGAIKEPGDPVTRFLEREFTVERGVALGGLTFGFGLVTASFLVVRWAASGFSALPLVRADVVAFTAILLGLQVMFGSFFAGVLTEVR